MGDPGEAMSSNRPYLLRALHEWISDNGLTPQILVDATVSGVDVPEHAVQNGKVVLNIGPRAVEALDIGNEEVAFRTRFSGNDYRVSLPVQAVLAVYARENGKGMMFAEEQQPGPDGDGPGEGPGNGSQDGGADAGSKRKRPKLKVVK